MKKKFRVYYCPDCFARTVVPDEGTEVRRFNDGRPFVHNPKEPVRVQHFPRCPGVERMRAGAKASPTIKVLLCENYAEAADVEAHLDIDRCERFPEEEG